MDHPHHRPYWSRPTSALAASVVLALAGGCSDGSGSSAAPVEGGTSLGSLVTESSEVANPRGAISWLDDFACDTDREGRWTASGTVVNPEEKPATVRVRVAVVVRTTGQVVGRTVDELTLEPGEERAFTYERFHASSAKKVKRLDCVPRVVRGDAQP